MKTKIKQACKTYLSDRDNRIFLILYLAVPCVLNLIIESLARKNIFGGFIFLFTKPYTFWCDVLIIMLTMSVAFLTRRRFFWMSLVSGVWILLGISNYILLCNRVTPFTAEDIKSISDVSGVLNKYFNHTQVIIACVIFALAVFGLVAVFRFAPKLKERLNVLKALGIIFIVYALMMVTIVIGINAGAVEAKFGELSKSYLKNGFAYCFSNSLINNGIKKPSNYSEETIEEITGKEDAGSVPKETEPPREVKNEETVETPNIIIVQLESFFDVNEVQGLEFSRNPLPNFTQLMEEWPSGYFSVPIVGAGTVNSEFEVMTGMNLDDFGPGEYPFKTIMRNTTCESMAFNLKEHGYTAQFVHNNTGRFYGRNAVYANLGFDTFTSVEYMQVENRTPMGWAKDYYLTNQIMQCLDYSENQDLIYAISVQGHGSYPADISYDRHLRIKEIGERQEEIKDSIEYYANQLYEMDAFIGQLVDELSNYEEDTILVMYGDHLPSLSFEDEDLGNESIYQTSYFIWNNMGLEFEGGDIEAYELSSILMEKLGIKDGVINQYHQNYKDTLEEEEYLNGLQNLEYDILYGDLIAYDGVNPYKETELQMGILPIEITDIYVDPEDEEGTRMIVKGTNFTTYSKVYINEEKKRTEFIDSSTLCFVDSDLRENDSIVVWQSALSCTDEYVYVPHTGESLESPAPSPSPAVSPVADDNE